MTNPTSDPEFTKVHPGEAVENKGDEERILTDQDQTVPSNKLTVDENMGARSNSLDTLENEPADFMRGEVDVKSAMDRAARIMDSQIRGHHNLDED